MPFRRFRRAFRRRRQRTRWFAIVPDGFTLNTNDFNTYRGLQLQTAGPLNSDLQNYTGGTLLRVILDVDFSPDIVFTDGVVSVGSAIDHFGLFIQNGTTSPSSSLWDANKPFGNFMYRDGVSWWARREGTGVTPQFLTSQNGGRRLHIDTNIRRKISEGDQLFTTHHFFKTGAWNGVDVGHTGRVLIGLP